MTQLLRHQISMVLVCFALASTGTAIAQEAPAPAPPPASEPATELMPRTQTPFDKPEAAWGDKEVKDSYRRAKPPAVGDKYRYRQIAVAGVVALLMILLLVWLVRRAKRSES